ncbi:DUF4129 domain-containing protein [Thermococcus paralvinellae]|uniref:Protein-glutamine gamma-glutamyltransferase-like C-terminal domain-containing protein n=1 Tax=Thermococcus paralvinellae TaxID=582419 RepID=W0I905_9EURY|nr:DUF4129 domain-containing protein [Thermococcus paralvinellae]AHF81237.1 Hypothetical protein TES1_1862 [Thermococcus paralvinellae]
MKRKGLALFLVLFLLMALIMSGQAKIEEIPKGSQNYYWIGLLFGIIVIAAGFIIIQILLSWQDLPTKGRADNINWQIIVAIFTGTLMLSLPLLFMVSKAQFSPITANNTTTQGVYVVNGSYHVTYYEKYFRNPVFLGNPSTKIILYGFFGIISAALIYLSIAFYRDLSTRRRVKKLREEIQEFDKRLKEDGISFIGDPKDIVIKLYKNAVIWLEILGIPYRESWTHWEHAERVKYKHDAYVELAQLFEKAKYAPEKVTMEDAKRAYELYLIIKGDEHES